MTRLRRWVQRFLRLRFVDFPGLYPEHGIVRASMTQYNTIDETRNMFGVLII